MSNSEKLGEGELFVLDAIINLEPILQHQLPGLWITNEGPLGTDQLNEILSKLSNSQLILIQKDNYQREIVSSNRLSRDKVDTILSNFWKEKHIERERLIAEIERDYTGILKALGLKLIDDDKVRISFSDYYSDFQAKELCQKLWKIDMAFKQTWSSKKHFYEEYFFRRHPIDVAKSLEELVVSRVNPEELELETDWRILIPLIFSETSVTEEDIRTNIPNLTSDEIEETLFRLQACGIVRREERELKIEKATKDIIKNYFILQRYQLFKSSIAHELRRRVRERASNLYLLGLVKRILSRTHISKVSEPFAIMKRDSISDISNNDLENATKLGLVFLTKKELIVAHEVILELEETLRSALSEETVYRVPANEIFTAITVWKEVFAQCKEYIKIQDEYVNEETLQILQSYVPSDVKLTILSSIKGARDLDVEEMKRRVEAMKNSGRKVQLLFIGYEQNGEAPFHERYIISKDVCYLISNSIKQVGKSKSASIALVSKEKKEGTVEPAFNYWTSSEKELRKLGIERLNFNEWLKRKTVE